MTGAKPMQTGAQQHTAPGAALDVMALVQAHPLSQHPLPRLFGAPDTTDAKQLIRLFAHLSAPMVAAVPGFMQTLAGRLVALRLEPQAVEALLTRSPWTSPRAGRPGEADSPVDLFRRFAAAAGSAPRIAGLTSLEQRALSLRQRLHRLADADRPGVAVGGLAAIEASRAVTGPAIIAGVMRHGLMRQADTLYFEAPSAALLEPVFGLADALVASTPGADRAIRFGAAQALAIQAELFDVVTSCSAFPSA
jgi:hypothetical protein